MCMMDVDYIQSLPPVIFRAILFYLDDITVAVKLSRCSKYLFALVRNSTYWEKWKELSILHPCVVRNPCSLLCSFLPSATKINLVDSGEEEDYDEVKFCEVVCQIKNGMVPTSLCVNLSEVFLSRFHLSRHLLSIVVFRFHKSVSCINLKFGHTVFPYHYPDIGIMEMLVPLLNLPQLFPKLSELEVDLGMARVGPKFFDLFVNRDLKKVSLNGIVHFQEYTIKNLFFHVTDLKLGYCIFPNFENIVGVPGWRFASLQSLEVVCSSKKQFVSCLKVCLRFGALAKLLLVYEQMPLGGIEEVRFGGELKDLMGKNVGAGCRIDVVLECDGDKVDRNLFYDFCSFLGKNALSSESNKECVIKTFTFNELFVLKLCQMEYG